MAKLNVNGGAIALGADQGDLPPPEHVENGPRAQDLSLLLRTLAMKRPNQVWATDIAYVPKARGFVSLFGIIDWFNRRLLAWPVSISLDAESCIEALEETLAC